MGDRSRTVLSAGATLARVVVRRAEVVPDLVGERELRHLGRHPAVVVDERDDARVEAPLGHARHPQRVLRVRLVALADAAGRARRRRHPRQSQRAPGEVTASTTRPISRGARRIESIVSPLPIGEHVGETKVLVVALRVQVEKVGHVDVGQAELVLLAGVVGLARLVVVDFDALHLEPRHPVRVLAVEFRVHVDGVHRLHVLRDERGDLLARVLRVVLLRLVKVAPQQRVRLDEERARRPRGRARGSERRGPLRPLPLLVPVHRVRLVAVLVPRRRFFQFPALRRPVRSPSVESALFPLGIRLAGPIVLLGRAVLDLVHPGGHFVRHSAPAHVTCVSRQRARRTLCKIKAPGGGGSTRRALYKNKKKSGRAT